MQLPYKHFVIWGQNEQEIGILYYSSATKHEGGFLIQGFCISEYVWYQSIGTHSQTYQIWGNFVEITRLMLGAIIS
jgi:hypothetical protein